MKNLIERIIQLRNPNFKLDPHLNSYAFFQFIWIQSWNMVRGLKFLFYFKSPKGALLGPNVHLFNAPKIQFGHFLKLGRNVYISALGKKGITLGNNVSIGDYSRVIISTSFDHLGEFIKIGNNVGIGEFAYLGGAGGLEIGDDCIVGQYLSCHPENHNVKYPNIPIRLQGVYRKGIVIGADCWIGSKVTILDGVHIGTGCIIAAGSVVTKSFESNSIIGGVPAKLLKSRFEN